MNGFIKCPECNFDKIGHFIKNDYIQYICLSCKYEWKEYLKKSSEENND